MNGFEFPARATAVPGDEFAHTVVIVLTTSMHADGYRRAADHPVVRMYPDKPFTHERPVEACRVATARAA